ncbi:hypothetical protein NW756_000199 [Fusarium oxysporum]|nr:hypothetical protein NW763_006650 [Fusarium oxysporum]KAJ4062682.1 hypothetical protein NW753_004152 [Fusarium oxysporum]KAJ4104442.1 hypothetical protein NW756_000199 [Fusarium oxysporum]
MLQVQSTVQTLTEMLQTVDLSSSGDELNGKYSWIAKCMWPVAGVGMATAGAALITKYVTTNGYTAMVTMKKDAQGNMTGTWILASPSPNPNMAAWWQNACNADTQDQHVDEGVSPGSAADFYRATLADLQADLNKSFASVLAE